MKTSQTGIDLIKRFEGLELESYKDLAGIWTIGYGHTGPEVGPDQSITESEAEALLRHDLASREKAISRLTRVPINQNEFDALMSFAYNVGVGAYQRSTARRRLNKGDREGAADALTWWNKATKNGVLTVIRGLSIRRAAEKALFLTPVENFSARSENYNDNSRLTPMEDAPRRGSIGDSRTVQGATVAGGAGIAASNMGRDASSELNKIETNIEKGIDPYGVDENPQGDASTSPETSTDNEITQDTENTVPSLEGGDETDASKDGTDNSTDEGLNNDNNEATDTNESEAETPSTEDNTLTTSVEEPESFPARDEHLESDAQIQFALMIIIILAVLYILFARVDDWFRYRR